MPTYKKFSFLIVFSLFTIINASEESAQKKRKINHDTRVLIEEQNLQFLSADDLVLKQKELCAQFGSTEESKEQLTRFIANQADMKYCIQEFLFDADALDEEFEKARDASQNSNFLNFTNALTMIQLYDYFSLQRSKSVQSYITSTGSTLLHITAMPIPKTFSNPTMQVQHLARQSSIVKLLIANGGDINKKDDNGDTPMHLAAANSNYSMIKKFHKNNNVMNIKNNAGETPMHRLICATYDRSPFDRSLNEQDIVMIERLVFLGAKLTIKNNQSETPMDMIPRFTPLSNLLKSLGGDSL